MSFIECKKYFTIEDANATLPLVQIITEDVVELNQEISDTRERLAYVANDSSDRSVYSKEVRAVELQTELKSQKLANCIDELLSLSLLPSDACDGHVDFPALRNGEDVCLCWRLGEPEVMYWHGTDEDCSCRRLVDLPLVHSSISRSFSQAALKP